MKSILRIVIAVMLIPSVLPGHPKKKATVGVTRCKALGITMGNIRTANDKALHRMAVESVEIAKRRGITGAPLIGLTGEEVRCFVGKPKEINTTITLGGTREQWVYAPGVYLYLDDGVVTAAQIRDTKQ